VLNVLPQGEPVNRSRPAHEGDAVARIEEEEGEFRPSRPGSHADPGALVAIAIGGALGALARYEVSQWIHSPQDTFPWATFWTNITGAFVLGLFLTVLIDRFPARSYPRPFFAIGFLGAFTTFSTLAVETVTLVKDGHPALGIAYLVVSIVAGLAVAFAGIAAGRAAVSRC
jgi:fluoride exporter